MLDPNYTASVGKNGGMLMPDQSKTGVLFFSRPKEFPAESREKGFPVWRDVDYVRVQQPGERDAIVLEVHKGHIDRWSEQWNKYQLGKSQAPEGTPLSILFPESEAMVLTFRALNIHTIEQLASMPDSATGNLPFGGEMKHRAQRYVESMQGAQGFNKLQGELDQANAKSSEMERLVLDLREQMQALKRAEVAPTAAPMLDPNLIAQLVAAEVAKHKPGRKPKMEA